MEDAEMSSGGPVGQGDYVVRSGDCLDSIAYAHGHFWETLWNESANAELKNVRKDPNVLMAGDRVTIPELREKEESRGCRAVHRFRRKGVPAKLRLRFMRYDEPRAGVAYTAVIDGKSQDGKLDGDGQLEIWIPPDARSAELILREDGEEQVFDLGLGQLDPIDQLSGVQARLNGLGFGCEPTGVLDDATRGALKNFQVSQELEASGEADDATRSALEKAFGS